MDVHAAGGRGRPDTAYFGIGYERSRRRLRHVFREPSHLPLPKRRTGARTPPQHRLPPCATDERFGSTQEFRRTRSATPTTRTSRTTRRDTPRDSINDTFPTTPLWPLPAMSHLAQMPLETYLLA